MNAEGDIDFIESARIDPGAFESLYERYFRTVYRFILFRVGYRKDIAEDISQETFFKAFQHIHQYRDEGTSYLTYLLKIAHNLVINYYRYAIRHASVSLDEVAELSDVATTGIEEEAQKKIQVDDLWNALSLLHPHERSILELRFKEQLSIKEIAQRSGKSENAVKLAILRAKKKLQNKTIFEIHAE